ncbi:hypothetical protein PoB_003707300 [Plakobranchus ocellatus]|uniref:Uncharacterized protein n=1 Tax=Plakobranchus ocellatus TaxID=259542 RepID=A0AAV4AT50_9GAST|nr:hypothetical protein PoB_003707300 [Plakobranchus ocellatus]
MSHLRLRTKRKSKTVTGKNAERHLKNDFSEVGVTGETVPERIIVIVALISNQQTGIHILALPQQDLVRLADVSTTALAFGWTGRPFTSPINVASSCNSVLCRHVVYLPWFYATLQELRRLILSGARCRISFHPGSSLQSQIEKSLFNKSISNINN